MRSVLLRLPVLLRLLAMLRLLMLLGPLALLRYRVHILIAACRVRAITITVPVHGGMLLVGPE